MHCQSKPCCGLWTLLWEIMCQCKPMDVTSGPPWRGMQIAEAALHLREQGLHRKSLLFPLNCVVTLKTSLEKKKKLTKSVFYTDAGAHKGCHLGSKWIKLFGKGNLKKRLDFSCRFKSKRKCCLRDNKERNCGCKTLPAPYSDRNVLKLGCADGCTTWSR